MNYDNYFDHEEKAPSRCPICKKHDFNAFDLDYTPVENGVKVMLICPICNYKKDMGIEKEEQYDEF